MTRPIIIRSPPSSSSLDKRQPLLASQLDSSTSSCNGGVVRKARFGEVVGGTTAECAAVACCCPCGIVNLLVLAVYKVPAGLCRKALRKRRRNHLLKKGRHCNCDEMEVHSIPISSPIAVVAGECDNKDVIELEKEMWDKFYGAGFWRSPSQRADM